jgi:hypothetical protein
MRHLLWPQMTDVAQKVSPHVRYILIIAMSPMN